MTAAFTRLASHLLLRRCQCARGVFEKPLEIQPKPSAITREIATSRCFQSLVGSTPSCRGQQLVLRLPPAYPIGRAFKPSPGIYKGEAAVLDSVVVMFRVWEHDQDKIVLLQLILPLPWNPTKHSPRDGFATGSDSTFKRRRRIPCDG